MGKNILKNKLAWLYIFFLIFNEFAFSQKTNQISGTIIFDNKPLKGAIIQLYNYESDSLITFTFSGSNGYFNLKIKYFMTAYTLKISHVSVNDTLINIHSFLPDSLDWNEIIVLNRRSKILEEIIIKAPSLPFKINGDTINYSADKYQANDVNKLEDLLKHDLWLDSKKSIKLIFQRSRIPPNFLDISQVNTILLYLATTIIFS
jgi:hypothetical protein